MADGQRETDALDETGLSPHPPQAFSRYREGDVLLGRFKVVRPVGHGGMGEVYEVRDLRLHARVAVKTVREPDDPGLIERLRREVQLARAVTHPNVCRVFDLHEGTGPDGAPLLFVTMEFLDGETLAGRIESGPLPPGEALPLLAQMADEGSQVIVATHSPLLMSLPGATLLEIGEWGLRLLPSYDDADLVQSWRTFLQEPDLYLRHLLD